MENEENIKRHKRMYQFGRKVLAPLMTGRYHYKTNILPHQDFNYIVVSNHLTEADFPMVASAFPDFMYIVAGEHLLRNKIAPFLLRYFDPIFEFKGAQGVSTVKEICTRTKAGYNVLLFPEGSRSFNGETEQLPVSIGKLIKMARCGLVTYHLTGGYFIAPRWGYNFRTGPAEGRVVRVFSPEEIKKMSAKEVTDIINQDL